MKFRLTEEFMFCKFSLKVSEYYSYLCSIFTRVKETSKLITKIDLIIFNPKFQTANLEETESDKSKPVIGRRCASAAE